MSLSRLIKSLKKKLEQNVTLSIGLDKQPDALLEVLGSYSGPKELANLASVNKHFHGLFQQKAKEAAIETLLTHVVRAEFDDVRAMLEKSPALSLLKGKATDYSGRVIYGTAYQMALGAVDTQMAEMIQSYLVKLAGEEEVIAQYQAQFPEGWLEAEEKEWAPIFTQLDALDQAIRTAPENEITDMGNYKLVLLEDKETTVSVALAKFHSLLNEMASHPVSTGRHFNPRLLLEIFRRYDEYFDNLHLRPQNPKCLLFWQRVIGYVQRFMPACDAQAFVDGLHKTARKLEGGDPQNRKLSTNFYSHTRRDWVNSSFYPLVNSCLAADYGIVAGMRRIGCRGGPGPWISYSDQKQIAYRPCKAIPESHTSCLISQPGARLSAYITIHLLYSGFTFFTIFCISICRLSFKAVNACASFNADSGYTR